MNEIKGMFFLKEPEERSHEKPVGAPARERSEESPYKSSLESITALRKEYEKLVLSDREADFLSTSKLLEEKITKTLQSLDKPNLSTRSKSGYLPVNGATLTLLKPSLDPT